MLSILSLILGVLVLGVSPLVITDAVSFIGPITLTNVSVLLMVMGLMALSGIFTAVGLKGNVDEKPCALACVSVNGVAFAIYCLTFFAFTVKYAIITLI